MFLGAVVNIILKCLSNVIQMFSHILLDIQYRGVYCEIGFNAERSNTRLICDFGHIQSAIKPFGKQVNNALKVY